VLRRYVVEVSLVNVAICDDYTQDAELIRGLLAEHLDNNGYIGDIHMFDSGEALYDAFTANPFDAVFLDIYMGGMSGIETAGKLRKLDPNFALVFITSSKNDISDAYPHKPNCYVVKPVTRDSIDNAFHNCQAVFLKNARYIEVMRDRAKIKIPLSKIMYIETYGRETVFHTTAGDHKSTSNMPLADIERGLNKAFLRCHKSYIVNMNFVDIVCPGEFKLINGNLVPMRQRRRDELRDAYARFVSDRLFGVIP
jgi:DNA-binding LytR/AlgR family response regulator